MIEKITEISELGHDWMVIGTDGGDCSRVKVKSSYKNFVVVVKVKNEQTKAYDDICILGQKKFLTSDDGYLLTKSIHDNYEDANIRSYPVDTHRFILDIYEEWNDKVSNGAVSIGTAKGEELELRNVRYANKLIKNSLDEGVSDVHIQVRETGTVVRKRIGVDLVVDRKISSHEGVSLSNTLYNVLAGKGSPAFDKNVGQDGLIDKVIEKKRIRGRISTSSVDGGFDMVIRLIDVGDGSRVGKTPKEMNYSSEICEKMEVAMTSPSGLTIIAGTTNSGKSTTLQNTIKLMIAIMKGRIKIIMIEEPVENFVDGATQINVQRDESGSASAGLEAAIRGALRQDPDVLVVGEIRDEQTARLSASAAQTGHKVMSTLHADSWLGVFRRLEGLGISREVLSSKGFLNGLFYQKLLPKVCQHCCVRLTGTAIPPRMTEVDIIVTAGYMGVKAADEWNERYERTNTDPNTSFTRFLQDKGVVSSAMANNISRDYKKLNNMEERQGLFDRISGVCDLDVDVINFRGKGCSHCGKLGVSGRTPVAEGAVFDSEMRSFILKKDDNGMLDYWRRAMNGKYVLEDAIEKMKQGIISPTDIEAQLERITISK